MTRGAPRGARTGAVAAGSWSQSDGIQWWGDLSDTSRGSIAANLLTGIDPGRQAPVTPWAVVVRRGPGGCAVTASPTLRSGLFYSAVTPGEMVVGVNIRDVLAELPQQTGLDWEFLRAFARGEAPGDRTPFAGVRRLTPGRTLLADADGWREQPWLVTEMGRGVTEGEYLRLFDATLAELVGPEELPAVAMSGGLDSVFLVGSLAQVLPPGQRIHAFVHRPARGCQVTAPPGWVHDDGPWVATVHKHLGDRLVIHEVRNDAGLLALDVCARQAVETLWPAWNPGNVVWLSAIHRQAAELGARAVLSGAGGNFAFSYPPGPPSPPVAASTRTHPLRSAARLARRRWLVYQSAAPIRWREIEVSEARSTGTAGDTRDGYAERVTGAARPHAAQLAPGNPGHLVTLDPFTARPIVELALAQGSDGWPNGPLGRAFARRVSHGRVPDEVRRRTSRGMQAADAWWSMRHHRDRYLDEVATVEQTPGVRDWIDTAHLRRQVAAWPWGEPVGPPLTEVRAVNRVLTLGAYINAMENFLRLPRTDVREVRR